MKFSLNSLVFFTRLAELNVAHVISRRKSPTENNVVPTILNRQGFDDPTKFEWVERFAAVGDSFTAGIGAGNQLGSIFHEQDDWLCSRYDLSYPMVMYEHIGSAIETFEFPACTGDTTEGIYKQIENLEGKFNLVTLTAGGNDLCLSNIIIYCIVISYFGESACTDILDKAQDNLDNIMHDNIKELLLALNEKMAENGIVVYNSYARYFNTENEDCSKKQYWAWGYWIKALIEIFSDGEIKFDSLPLTIERREKFNGLAKGLNDMIRKVVHEVEDDVDYTVGFSNWEAWAIDGVKGQMCHPDSSGAYPDSDQPDLLFIKHDTRTSLWSWIVKRDEAGFEAVDVNGTFTETDAPVGMPPPPFELTRSQKEALKARLDEDTLDRDANGVPRTLYRTRLWNSVNPRADVLKKLDARAPSPPGCPGDGILSAILGFITPDWIGQLFHPNDLGHNAIASFAIAKTIDLRAKVLGVEPEVCVIDDEFTCWKKEGYRGYVSAKSLDDNYKKFCDSVQSENAVKWKYESTYYHNTVDEFDFIVRAPDFEAEFDKDECKDSFKRIIHGCDGNDPENPMNWKSGGKYKRGGAFTYQVNIKRGNRPWPPIKETYGSCHGWWHLAASDYIIRGAGWANSDWGQKSVLSSAKSCVGGGVTGWKFEYYDEPDENGMEWKAQFNTPVFVNNRCFKNNKVAFGAGGFTDGCKGSGWA